MAPEPDSNAADFVAALSRFPAEDVAAMERQAASDLLDPEFYLAANPDVAAAGVDPLEHFLHAGWRELRKPRRDFDVWWYWANYLDPASDALNPLLHYAAVGRDAGLLGRPDVAPNGPGCRLPADRPVRRAILFAAFDAEGRIDAATHHYLAELARHGDVFYLADCYIAPAELARLDGVVAGAWAQRHGAYDFGSYATLARDLVGWDTLATYDEVLFVNDSCFLLRPLDEVFSRMDAEACDWWGLQTTKGLASTQGTDPLNHFSEPIAFADVVAEHLTRFEDSPSYDFHVGSYFMAFRAPVLDDPAFRRLVDSVRPEPSKLRIIQKYEIGLTHLLLGRGYRLATFLPYLYPFHPLFTEWAFTLIDHGFPLLKQYFLEHNHYDTPGLAAWRERVLAAVPDARVDLFEERLWRTGADDRIQRSLAVTRRADGAVDAPTPVPPAAFWDADAVAAKERTLWSFVVDPVTHRLAESNLAVLHAAARQRGRQLWVLTRSHAFDVTPFSGSASPVQTLPVTSPAGQQRLLRSGTVLVSGDPWAAAGVPLRTDGRTVVVARDGFARLSADAPANPQRRVPTAPATGLLATSDVDLLMALPQHWPLTYDNGWRTGLPAHDLLTMPAADLPESVRTAEARLRELLAGRRLVVVAAGSAPDVRMSPDDARRLLAAAAAQGAVVGVRSPDGDLVRPYDVLFGGEALDLSPARQPSRSAVLRVADLVVTDDDGLALDLLLAGRHCRWLAGTGDDRTVDDLRLFDPLPSVRADALVGSVSAVLQAPDAPVAVPARASRLLDAGPGATGRTLRALDEGSRR